MPSHRRPNCLSPVVWLGTVVVLVLLGLGIAWAIWAYPYGYAG